MEDGVESVEDGVGSRGDLKIKLVRTTKGQKTQESEAPMIFKSEGADDWKQSRLELNLRGTWCVLLYIEIRFIPMSESLGINMKK